MLIDEVGDNENHPLAEVLHYLGERVQDYEDRHVQIPEAEPREVLRLLMEQHGLKHEDLPDCAPRSRISDILNGRRAISKEIASALADASSGCTQTYSCDPGRNPIVLDKLRRIMTMQAGPHYHRAFERYRLVGPCGSDASLEYEPMSPAYVHGAEYPP